MKGGRSDQASRPISTGPLKALRLVHAQPINPVVCRGSVGACAPGDIILGGAWHLDAFSAYLFRTWLRSDASDETTATPEVRPTRSSRTKVGIPQVSCAHSG